MPKRIALVICSVLMLTALTISAVGAQDMDTGNLYATLNPGEAANDALVLLADDLSSAAATFGGLTDVVGIQSVWYDSSGNAYVSVDVTAEAGAVYVYEGMMGAESMDLPAPTRIISGASTELAAPKGLIVIEDLGMIVVANNGGKSILGFPLDAEGDVAPEVKLNKFGYAGGSVWDVWYSREMDTLMAAGTTGWVLLYENFSDSLGENLSKTLVPANADGSKISVNLHGIQYDAGSDTLFLTDVGAADSNTDGQIFVINSVSEANGITPVAVQIGGDQSGLGNPVDLAFDGMALIVAEKANDAILRYDTITELSGSLNQAADFSATITKPESLAFAGGM